MEKILDHLPKKSQPMRAFLSSILYEQVLTYPKWSKIPAALQCNGQLMGSVLSFPVLCILNLFTYYSALPKEFRSRAIKKLSNLQQLPVLVNGDDILFKATPSLYESWKSSSSSVGFSLSVGKNFIHHKYFTVNSVPCTLSWKFTTRSPVIPPGVHWGDVALDDVPIVNFPVHYPEAHILGYINVGLLTGQAKLTGRQALLDLPLSGWYGASVPPSLDPNFSHKRFLFYHKRSIRSQTKFGQGLNIFAHPFLGGLGFPKPPGVETHYSPFQRKLAFSLLQKYSEYFEGLVQDYALTSLLYIKQASLHSPEFLGRIRRYKAIALYPYSSPLPVNGSPLLDDSLILPLPLQQQSLVNEISDVQPSCRLSAFQLREAIDDTRFSQMLEPTEMEIFPFVPLERREGMWDKDGSFISNSTYWNPNPSILSQEISAPPDQPRAEWEDSFILIDKTIPPPSLPSPKEEHVPFPHFHEVEEVILPVSRTTRSSEQTRSSPRKVKRGLRLCEVLTQAQNLGFTLIDGKVHPYQGELPR